MDNIIGDIIKHTTPETDLLFSDMVINAGVVQILQELKQKHQIKNNKALAKMLGVKKEFIDDLFCGDSFFDVRFLTTIQQKFGVTIELKIK